MRIRSLGIALLVFLLGCSNGNGVVEESATPFPTPSESASPAATDEIEEVVKDWMGFYYNDSHIHVYGVNSNKVPWTVEKEVIFEQDGITIFTIGYAAFTDLSQQWLELLITSETDQHVWFTSEYLTINGYEMVRDEYWETNNQLGSKSVKYWLAYDTFNDYGFTDIGSIGGLIRMESDEYELVSKGEPWEVKTSKYGQEGTYIDGEHISLFENSDVKVIGIKTGPDWSECYLEVTNKHDYGIEIEPIFCVFDAEDKDGNIVANDSARYTLIHTGNTGLIPLSFVNVDDANSLNIHLQTVNEGSISVWNDAWTITLPE